MADENDIVEQRLTLLNNVRRAGDEVARFIGMAVLSGKTFLEIIEQLEQMRNQIRRDAAINSQMPTMNPFMHVLEAAIEKLHERC